MRDVNIILKDEIEIEEGTIDNIMDIGVKIININHDINVINAKATHDMVCELQELDDIEIVKPDEPATLI